LKPFLWTVGSNSPSKRKPMPCQKRGAFKRKSSGNEKCSYRDKKSCYLRGRDTTTLTIGERTGGEEKNSPHACECEILKGKKGDW